MAVLEYTLFQCPYTLFENLGTQASECGVQELEVLSEESSLWGYCNFRSIGREPCAAQYGFGKNSSEPCDTVGMKISSMTADYALQP